MQFKEAEEYGGTEDFRCSCMFNGKSPWELYDTLEPAQKEVFDDLFYGTGHKIGGYSYFTQTDPRDYGQEHKNDVSLLQIDSDDKIMFGDTGTAHFFINKDDLKTETSTRYGCIGIAVKQMGSESVAKIYGKANGYERNLCN